MPEVVIADTSCFIALSRIDGLEIMREVYGEVSTTNTVVTEFGRPLPSWIRILDPTDDLRTRALSVQVDRGEASAIALALEMPGCTVILDDRKARSLATTLGLNVTGTLGVIVKAKLNGHIPDVASWFARLRSAGFRASPAVEQVLLEEAGES